MFRNCLFDIRIGSPQPKNLFYQQLPRTLQPSEFVVFVVESSRTLRHSFEFGSPHSWLPAASACPHSPRTGNLRPPADAVGVRRGDGPLGISGNDFSDRRAQLRPSPGGRIGVVVV